MRKQRNYGLLRELIRTHGYDLNTFASAIGLSYATLIQKLNSRSAWRSDEIERVCYLLQIGVEDIGAYFFYEVNK